jgi:hypothetical protein
MKNKQLIEIIDDLRDDLWLKREAIQTDKDTQINSIEDLLWHLENWKDYIITNYLTNKKNDDEQN